MTASPIWRLHPEGYLVSDQASVLVFHNDYPSGMQGGVELIQHDVRLATDGFLFALLEKGKASGYPKIGERRVFEAEQRVEATSSIAELGITCTTAVEPDGDGVSVSVSVDKSLGEAGSELGYFSLCLYPPEFWGKSYVASGASGVFQRAFVGDVEIDDVEGRRARPLATGPRIDVAPEDREIGVRFESKTGALELHDRRYRYDGEWFAVRERVAAGKSGELVRWRITPARIDGWSKRPMIAVSQVGYHPAQHKRAILELGAGDTSPRIARLLRIDPDRGPEPVLEATAERWGEWLRYGYAVFDFSNVGEEGVYLVECEGERAGPFRIARDVFAHGVWQPTLHCYFPVQMCHMHVWEGGRLWHAACHLDDAMQVPSPTAHFDGYAQGPESDTPFEPYQHIEHLDRGGWHDAGDTDLAAGSQAATTHVLALAREEFGIATDQTTVRWDERLVRISEPDGVPDIVQQVAHGVECLLGGHRACGHSFTGIIDSLIERYHQRGEVSAASDNRIYDPALGPGEVAGNRSGDRDDRFAFTNRDTGLEYQVSAALAAASRVLRGWFDALADEALATAERAWQREQASEPARHRMTYVPGDADVEEVRATVELFLTTGSDRYRARLVELAPVILEKVARTGWLCARVLDRVFEGEFLVQFRERITAHAAEFHAEMANNPFGIVWRPHIWGVGWDIQNRGVELYYLQRAFPDLFDSEALYRIVHWVLGCHAGNDVSFVSGVGTRSLTVAFGINRSEFSHIPGGNASGTALVRPDFPELKAEFPFLWQQSEYVMSGAATYLFVVVAVDRLLAPSSSAASR